MKPYLIIGLVAALAVASCDNDDAEDLPDYSVRAISFAPEYVQGMARSELDFTTDNLPFFYVNGFIGANSTPTQIFNNEQVTRSGSSWTYASTKYWLPDNHYFFTAYFPSVGDSVNTVYYPETSSFVTRIFNYNLSQTDLILAQPDTVYVTSQGDLKSGTNISSSGTTYLTFNHILSKLKINVTSDFASGDNLKFVLTGITLNNCSTKAYFASATSIDHQNGTLSTSNEWYQISGSGSVAATDTVNGQVESIPIVLIPTYLNDSTAMSVTINGDLYQGNVKVKSPVLKGVINDFTLDIGNYYIFNASITESNVNDNQSLNPIVFTLGSVTGWNSNSGTINPDEDNL